MAFKPNVRKLDTGGLEFSGANPVFGRRGARSSISGTNVLHDILTSDFGWDPQAFRLESDDSAGTFRLQTRDDFPGLHDSLAAALAQLTSDPVLAGDLQPGMGEVPMAPATPGTPPPGPGLPQPPLPPPTPGGPQEPTDPLKRATTPSTGLTQALGYLYKGSQTGPGVTSEAAFPGAFLFAPETGPEVPAAYGRGPTRTPSLSQLLRQFRFFYGDRGARPVLFRSGLSSAL